MTVDLVTVFHVVIWRTIVVAQTLAVVHEAAAMRTSLTEHSHEAAVEGVHVLHPSLGLTLDYARSWRYLDTHLNHVERRVGEHGHSLGGIAEVNNQQDFAYREIPVARKGYITSLVPCSGIMYVPPNWQFKRLDILGRGTLAQLRPHWEWFHLAMRREVEVLECEFSIGHLGEGRVSESSAWKRKLCKRERMLGASASYQHSLLLSLSISLGILFGDRA